MKLIRSLMGRRQFLIAAGAASTLGLGYKKITGFFNPGIQTNVAMASDKPDAEGTEEFYSDRYSHLLSPLKIGNVVLKNRMLATRSLPSHLQGPETYPADPVMSHVANVARNGAAIVTVSLEKFDLDNAGVQNYIAQLTDAIHFYGAKANVCLTQFQEPRGYSISDITPPVWSGQRRYFMFGQSKEMPVDMIHKMNEDFGKLAKRYQELGFDMACIYMSYRSSIFACSLSPAMNKRTDQYGGSLENRTRITIELCQAIKKECGQDFLIEAQVSGEEEAGGYTLEDLVKYVKLWEGYIDILQLRGWDLPSSHPMGYNSKKGEPITLRYAEAIKKSGTKIVVAPVGGYQDLDLNEEFIASGKADMIAMARSFICDPEYGQKAYEGRGEDVVPCILCNKCHGNIYTPNLDVCSVNPKLGFAHKIDRMIAEPVISRKVAVIGGGPAGMKGALVAAERGHKVTLFEKGDTLGGLLRHTDFASFQWPLKDYKDYLIRQIKKKGIEVQLKTTATHDMIKAKKYDAVLVAVGAEPVIPNIPGADGKHVYNVVDVYGKEKALGKNIVVIGGDQIGSETGMYLAEKGHSVTVLTSSNQLMKSEGSHQDIDLYQGMKKFSYITEATAKSIFGGKVTYVDAKGYEKSIQADSVVIYAGFKPKLDEALKFSGSADRFFTIGDCYAVGGFVRACTRTAFAAASQL
ncbi:FAD-dependent oxidoreductase [Deltaproteobacteria bacterium]|nr:FAD-dependent oxidoreductase [Deltaproteobacteria bacterium]